MIRADIIKDGFKGLIGWQDDYSEANIKLSSELQESETGLYYNQVHTLLTLHNLKAIAPLFSGYSAPNWSTQSYNKDTIISNDSKIYKSIKSVVATDIPGTSDSWIETTFFSEWLLNKTNASILKAINHFYNDKLAKQMSKSILENRRLYDGTGRLLDTINNNKKLVGLELQPLRSKGVVLKINSICLQTNGIGEIPVYIYHSSCLTPVYSLTLNKTVIGTQWFTVKDIYLPYSSDLLNISAGGSWYIVYKQDDLDTLNQKAINMVFDWQKGPCTTCNLSVYKNWILWSKFVGINPFYIASSDINQDNTIWDINRMLITYDFNYGLNLDISILCDISDLIVENKYLFQDVISKQVAADLLREFVYNPQVRINNNALNASRRETLYELDGDSTSIKITGLVSELNLAYKGLDMNTKGLDRICFTCRNNGVRYRTV
jgi:hypothetical protein